MPDSYSWLIDSSVEFFAAVLLSYCFWLALVLPLSCRCLGFVRFPVPFSRFNAFSASGYVFCRFAMLWLLFFVVYTIFVRSCIFAKGCYFVLVYLWWPFCCAFCGSSDVLIYYFWPAYILDLSFPAGIVPLANFIVTMVFICFRN